ncbi:hypothetical protein DSO57_1031982 [Entomophthora muscae]|uniref:Uncharacterized protein n=1 Tax=Entomophthora muscae TaxID=34485 RepID=A0ACC2UL34_9FUNG|nr:hypothetical protein DSO57_1031982 [Entomophthora muscae]
MYRDRAAERRRGENPDYIETEKILATLEAIPTTDTTPDHKLAYDQSKYLGGDAKHTHLVKGLDYALLAKQRAQIPEIEEVTDEDLEKLYKEKQREQASNKDDGAPKFMTGLGERIYAAAFELPKKRPSKNELFLPGRMTYIFELADETGDQSNAFAIPTAVIRSRADFEDEVYGSADPASDLVVEKIGNIFANYRLGIKSKEKGPEPIPRETPEQSHEQVLEKPQEVAAPVDENIFSDVDSDYELDLDAQDSDPPEEVEPTTKVKPDYFPVKEIEPPKEPPQEYSLADMVKQASLQAASYIASKESPEPEEEGTHRRSIFEEPPDLNVKRDFVRADCIEDDSGLMYNYSDSDEDAPQRELEVMDEGTSKNKRKQLSRWDFDDEEAWARYKEKQVHMPKAAFQFGVKMSEGRSQAKKSSNPEEKLNREYQKLKSFMDKKFKDTESKEKPANRNQSKRHRRQ